jgi:type IV pilus assembly protein PilM
MVQLEQTDTSLQVVSKASQYLEPLPEMAEDKPEARQRSLEKAWDQRLDRIKQFIRQKVMGNGFRGRNAVISLPNEHLVIEHVRMTPMQPDELIGALPWELQGKLPFDPRAAVIRHIVAGAISENNETKNDVIVLAARRATVERHVSAVERLGLRVSGVGIEPCAMCYPYAFAALHRPPSQEGPPGLMLVHMGGYTTHVAIVRGLETSFVKDVEMGAEHFARAIAASSGQAPAEVTTMRRRWCEAPEQERSTVTQEATARYSLIRREIGAFTEELQSCMRYHSSLSRGAQVERVVFLGPEARDRAFVNVVGAHLALPTEVGDPVGAASGRPGAAEPEIAVAAGLSLFSAQ